MLLRNLPNNRIVSVLTHAMKSDMALPTRMERTLTYSWVNPTWGPVMENSAWRALLLSVLRTDVHLFLCNILVEGGVSGGTVVLKICHMTPDVSHCTGPGVSCSAVANIFTFGFVLLIGEEDTDKGCRSAFLWGFGGGWGWLISN